MIYFNGHPVSGGGIGERSRNNNEGGALGFWPWESSKWRYYFGMEAGRVAKRVGPLWLTDHDAAVREADIVQEGLSQGRALSSVRYDWDESAGRWRLA